MNHAIAVLALGLLPAAAWAADGPTFEVASIKVSAPDSKPPYRYTGGPGTDNPERFHGPHMSYNALLTRAFGLYIDQIRGPQFVTELMSQNYFDVDAVIPPNTTREQFQVMFQNLLIERFHLAYHREKRGFPGYQLVVDAGGAKVKEVTPDPNPALPTPDLMTKGQKGEDGFPVTHGPLVMTTVDNKGNTRVKYQEYTMAQFASALGSTLGSAQGKGVLQGALQPRIVDKTGLTGAYTMILEYSDAGMAAFGASLGMGDKPAAASSSGSLPAASDPGGSADLATALRRQLGLRLEKTADVQLDVVVVDSMDKTPIEN